LNAAPHAHTSHLSQASIKHSAAPPPISLPHEPAAMATVHRSISTPKSTSSSIGRNHPLHHPPARISALCIDKTLSRKGGQERTASNADTVTMSATPTESSTALSFVAPDPPFPRGAGRLKLAMTAVQRPPARASVARSKSMSTTAAKDTGLSRVFALKGLTTVPVPTRTILRTAASTGKATSCRIVVSDSQRASVDSKPEVADDVVCASRLKRPGSTAGLARKASAGVKDKPVSGLCPPSRMPGRMPPSSQPVQVPPGGSSTTSGSSTSADLRSTVITSRLPAPVSGRLGPRRV